MLGAADVNDTDGFIFTCRRIDELGADSNTSNPGLSSKTPDLAALDVFLPGRAPPATG